MPVTRDKVVAIPVPDPLAVLLLDNQLFMDTSKYPVNPYFHLNSSTAFKSSAKKQDGCHISILYWSRYSNGIRSGKVRNLEIRYSDTRCTFLLAVCLGKDPKYVCSQIKINTQELENTRQQ